MKAPYENTRAPRVCPIRQIDHRMDDVILVAQLLSQERYASPVTVTVTVSAIARAVQAVVCFLDKIVSRICPAFCQYKSNDVLQYACLRFRLLDVIAYHCELFVQRVVLWCSAPSRHSAERLARKAGCENIRPAMPHLTKGFAMLQHFGSVIVKVVGFNPISCDEQASMWLPFCPDDVIHLNASHSEKHTETVRACVHGVHGERFP